MRAFP